MARGMTLIETMLAVGMTALVGAGISGMMHVLSNDVAMQVETRTGVVRAALVQARLSAYVGRARCLLDLQDDAAVLWLEDADGDDAVHATEIRWMQFDADTGDALVRWLQPENTAALPIYDEPEQVDWAAEFSALAQRTDVIAGSLALAGDLQQFTFREVLAGGDVARRRDAMRRHRVEVDLGMQLGDTIRLHRVGESIRLHREPAGEAAP